MLLTGDLTFKAWKKKGSCTPHSDEGYTASISNSKAYFHDDGPLRHKNQATMKL